MTEKGAWIPDQVWDDNFISVICGLGCWFYQWHHSQISVISGFILTEWLFLVRLGVPGKKLLARYVRPIF